MNPIAELPWSQWLPRQRWYAGHSRALSSVRPRTTTTLRDGLDLAILDAAYTEGSVERYQVVVQWNTPPQPDCRPSAVIGTVGERTACDGLYQADSARLLLSLIDASAKVGEVRFGREPGAEFPDAADARVVDAEQSNTSVVFGQRAILKLFRRVDVGVNPDIELNRVLTRSANPHVARLLGSFALTDDGQQYPLGMVSAYVANSADGWQIATARNGDLSAGESFRLGEALAAVHADLAGALGACGGTVPVEAMRARLAAAAAAVPGLADYVAAIEQRYAQVAGAPITVQRIHGDLHLGQVLRTPDTWLLIDFEGEPGRPLAQRRQSDSPLRDVAGMLRSFDYAAHHSPDAHADRRSGALARAWADRNGAAFCDGYAATSDVDPRAHADVLAAYQLDRAVYEADYEARYRPHWLHIPISSISRIAGLA